MPSTPEGRVKAAVKKLLKGAGIWFYMPIQNGMGRTGIPDFICCASGQFLAIETKAPGKRNNLTANQAITLAEINEASGWTLVIDDPNTLMVWLKAHGYVGHH